MPDNPYVQPEVEPVAVPFGAWLASVLSTLVWWVLTVWIAVRWHRFVLLEEHPVGAIPPWDGALVRAYVVRSVEITLVTIAATIGLVLALLLAVLLPPAVANPLTVIAGLLLTVVLIALPLRIGLGLPAAALGARMSTAGSWRATAPAWGSILVLAALSVLLSYALHLLTALPGLPVALRLAVSLVMGWIELMVWAAVLTTL